MAEVAVNTLTETRKLKSAGFTQKQAEATVEAIHTIATTNVAQKSDIEVLKGRIDSLNETIDINQELNNVNFKRLDDKIESSQAFYVAEMKAAISRSTNLILTCILAAVIGVFSVFFAFL